MEYFVPSGELYGPEHPDAHTGRSPASNMKHQTQAEDSVPIPNVLDTEMDRNPCLRSSIPLLWDPQQKD